MREHGILTTVVGRRVPVMHQLYVDDRGAVSGSLLSPSLTQEDVTCGPNDRMILELEDVESRFKVVGRIERE